jgi:hypothetical protein
LPFRSEPLLQPNQAYLTGIRFGPGRPKNSHRKKPKRKGTKRTREVTAELDISSDSDSADDTNNSSENEDDSFGGADLYSPPTQYTSTFDENVEKGSPENELIESVQATTEPIPATIITTAQTFVRTKNKRQHTHIPASTVTNENAILNTHAISNDLMPPPTSEHTQSNKPSASRIFADLANNAKQTAINSQQQGVSLRKGTRRNYAMMEQNDGEILEE